MTRKQKIITILDSELQLDMSNPEKAKSIVADKILQALEGEQLAKERKEEETNYDPLCFHDCPICHGRCNCNTAMCSHCDGEENYSGYGLK